MTAQRDSLIKKIKALLGKTTENGCTEAEAMTAAAHAALLMQQYDLTFKDVENEVRHLKFGAARRPFTSYGSGYWRRRHRPVSNCVGAIAKYFDCECWFSETDLVFFGATDDTGLAHDMVTMLSGTIEHETNARLARVIINNDPRTVRASFQHGMTDRLNRRLTVLKKNRTKAGQQAHEALAAESASASTFHPPVVVAKQLVVQEKYEEYIEEHGLKLLKTRTSRTTGSHDAYRAGVAAGERVSLVPKRGLLK